MPVEQRAAIRQVVRGLPWWVPLEHACWQRPEGPGSHVHDRPDHPVVHVSWHDAQAYCAWAGRACRARRSGSMPRAAASRAGASPGAMTCSTAKAGRAATSGAAIFPKLLPTAGRRAPVAAAAGEANGFGLRNVCGNVWEWCADSYSPTYHRETAATDPRLDRPTGQRVMRGGSFLCHDSYCNRYRVAARHGNAPGSTAGNIGFRVAAD